MTLSRDRIAPFVIAVPLLSLAYNALSWLRFGIDLPFQDDWGEFRRGTAGSFGLENLFRPGNDTLYPVGRFFDAAAQNLLDGNSVAYQFLSMLVVLGLLLFFQWRLLRLVIDDRLNLAFAFLLTLFILQPDTYWGRQNMAYHQALPLVCILASLYLALGTKAGAKWVVPVAFLVSLIAGFSYISGAIAMLAAGLTLTMLGFFIDRREGRAVLHVGMALVAGAAVAVPAQLWVIFGNQAGQTHRPDAAWTFPYQADFWLFLLGTIARSLLLPKKIPIVGLAVTACICLAMVVIAIRRSTDIVLQRSADLPAVRLTIIFVTLLSSIAAYLCIVSAGRAGLRPEDVEASSDVFVSGYRRFYFAWVTLLWPWLAAIAVANSSRMQTGRLLHANKLVPALILVVSIGGIVFGTFSHAAYYGKLNRGKAEAQVACLQQQLQQGAGILCPRLHPGDLAAAYIYAKSIGASFTRLFPLPDFRPGVQDRAPLFSLSAAVAETWTIENSRVTDSGADGVSFEPNTDPSLIIQISDPNAAGECLHLQASLAGSSLQHTSVKVLFRGIGETTFREAQPSSATFDETASPDAAHLHAESRTGFKPDVRIDLGVQRPGDRIRDIELRCTLRKR